MKIKKVNSKLNTKNLFKLKLLKSESYSKKQYLKNITIESIEYRIKKMLHIIYKFHVLNKKILFIGAPYLLSYEFNKLIKEHHIVIPDKIWKRGSINNKATYFKHFLKNQKPQQNKLLSNVLIQLKKKIDLIVILENSHNYEEILKEGYKAKIPIILIKNLNNSNFILHQKSTYNVFGNFQLKQNYIRDSFLYDLILSTLQKSTPLRIKNKKRYKAYLKLKKIYELKQKAWHQRRKQFFFRKKKTLNSK